MIEHENLSKRSILLRGMVVFAVVLGVFFIYGNNSDDKSVRSEAQYEILPVATIWPAVESKTLVKQELENRPSTDPKVRNIYCVHYYQDDSYVHQYIGQAPYGEQGPTCG